MLYSRSELEKYTKDELVSLLKEIRNMSNMKSPANHIKTSNMSYLFDCAKTPYNTWLDQYHDVSQSIEKEILYRIVNNNW